MRRTGLRENRGVRTDPWRSPALQPPPCRTLSAGNSPPETGGPSLGTRRCSYSLNFRFALLCSKGIHRPIFLTYEHPINPMYRKLTCSKPGIHLDLLDYTARSAVISAGGDLSDAVIEIELSSKPV